ncbi:MAG TPA: 23S rRNA pseudouridine(955/2504/2580) synthase RluC [Pseudomonadales bacterium]|nr:23S rRNA pseudouridine(955/2504/2580) synthase RluC [Pseudomonadales bacterium]
MNQPPNKPSVRFIEIGEERAGQRLDNFLLAELGRPPKSVIYKMIRKGEVRINKGRCKPENKLALGDVVRIPPFDVPEADAPVSIGNRLLDTIRESIIYDCAEFMVINKPSGLAVHGGSGLSFGLIEALRQIFPDNKQMELVHRLDRDTSGCIVVAKKRAALREFHRMLREGEMDKRYWALVEGRWPNRKKMVSAPLKKNELRSGERVVRVSPEGKESLTEFAVLRRFSDSTLVEAKPITGRTHQIRVHAQYAGHPLIGDDKYGTDQVNQSFKNRGIGRLFLHAQSLSFPWKKSRISVEAPLESVLIQAMEAL